MHDIVKAQRISCKTEYLLSLNISQFPLDTPEDAAVDNVDLQAADGGNAPAVTIGDLRRRFALRSTSLTWKERNLYCAAYITTNVNKHLNLEPRQRIRAMAKEILGVAIKKRAFLPVKVNKLTYKQMKRIIS